MTLEEMLPEQQFVTDTMKLASGGMLGGFIVAVSFWVLGYAVRSLVSYLRGGV